MTAAVFLRIVEAGGHAREPTASHRHHRSPGRRLTARHAAGGGGGGGGGGPSTGTVIGGRPGISTTVWPIGAGNPGRPGIAPGGGGGGGGGMPLEIWIVMIDPGTVCPVGDVPTTAAVGRRAVHRGGLSATWKPASRSRCRAVSWFRPDTLGTREPGAPST